MRSVNHLFVVEAEREGVKLMREKYLTTDVLNYLVEKSQKYRDECFKENSN